MSRLAPVVVIVAFAAAAGVAAAVSGGPPLVRERFTPLPCAGRPGHRTTVQMEGCAEHQILALDASINAADRAIWNLWPTNSARADFAAGIRSWIAYRRADCLSASDVFQGGSEAGVVFAQCEVARDQVRLHDLRTLESELRRG